MSKLNSSPQKVNLLIVDDHYLIRKAIGAALSLPNDHQLGFTISESENGEQALEKVRAHYFHIALVDYSMPRMNGAETIQKIIKIRPSTRILGLSNFNQAHYVREMMSAGAKGYVLKNIEYPELITAIKTVLDGRKYVCNEVVEHLMHEGDEIVPANIPDRTYSLTKREAEIVQLIARGYTSEQIGQKLFISKRTVEAHRLSLLHKLNVKNTAGLMKYLYSLSSTDDKAQPGF